MNALALLGGSPIAKKPVTYRWPRISENATARVQQMLREGEISYYGRAGAVAQLEDAFARRFEAEHALAVSTGTAGLHSAFFALGISRGDEVIVPSLTFLATVMPLFTLGAVPVPADSVRYTFNINVDQIERLITGRTRAIVVTHMFGLPCDMEPIVALARRHALALIEDCSHAHGAVYHGVQVGTFGDAAVFSLGAQKPITGGLGGMVTFRDRNAYERAVLFGHFNARALEEVSESKLRPFAETGLGLNYRMHPVAAAMILEQLPHLDEIIANRTANLGYLTTRLEEIPGLVPPMTPADGTRGAWYGYYPILRDELEHIPREAFVAALSAEGCPSRVPQYKPLHSTSVFQAGSFYETQLSRAYSDDDLPICLKDWSRCFPVPTFTDPGERWKIDLYGDAIAKVITHGDELAEAWAMNSDESRPLK
jgi:perosamine synthetase